jgi:hypothetical protein
MLKDWEAKDLGSDWHLISSHWSDDLEYGGSRFRVSRVRPNKKPDGYAIVPSAFSAETRNKALDVGCVLEIEGTKYRIASRKRTRKWSRVFKIEGVEILSA